MPKIKLKVVTDYKIFIHYFPYRKMVVSKRLNEKIHIDLEFRRKIITTIFSCPKSKKQLSFVQNQKDQFYVSQFKKTH